MATVINTPGATRTDTDSAAGWAVAAIVLVAAVLIALFVWPGFVRQSSIAPSGGTNINVTAPAATPSNTGTTDTGASGGTTGGASTGGTSQTPVQTTPTQ